MAHEVVNVFNELTTNTWQGSSPYFTETSDKKVSFDITADLVNKFRMSTYYVKGKGGTLGCVKKASDSNNGTFFDPFETFDKALAAVAESESNNDTGSTIDEYNIYIDGTVSVTQALVFNAKKKVNISSYADAAELKRTATSNLTLTAESGSDTKISGITTDCSLYVKAGSSLALNSCSVTGTEASGTEQSAKAVTVEKDGTFTVSDKVKICDKSVHNVYLKEGALITIGKGGLSIGSKIGVTLEKNPDVNNPCVTVTSGWGGTQVEKLIFSDDNYVAWKTGTPSEVCICVSSVSVTIPKFVVKFSIQSESETAVTTVARGDTITIVPQVYKDGTLDATASDFTAWKISLLNHGVDTDAVSSENTITVPGADAKGNKWPVDKYELYVTVDYKDTTYSSKIPVNIK